MTSCIPLRQLIFNGSVDSLSSLALLRKDSKFTHVKSRNKPYSSQIIKTTPKAGQYFKISGEIKLRKDGRIDWKRSDLENIYFRDARNRLNNFQITDYWQFGFNLESLIKSNSVNYLNLILSKGFELRGNKRENTLDFASMPIKKKYSHLSISGGAGADMIIGSNRNDSLAASTSRDICDFGSGTNLAIKVKDVLTGGRGVDTFYVDNGTRITDVDVGETIHLFNHHSYDLGDLSDKMPLFRYKTSKTIIRIGDVKIITNPAKYSYVYKFLTPKYEMCQTNEHGTVCGQGWIPGESEGYTLTAIEVI